MSTNSFEHLLPPSWSAQVAAWLAEDTPSFDYGGYVVGETHREAFLFGKGTQTAVLAGRPFFTEVFKQLGCEYVLLLTDVIRAVILGLQGRMAHAGGRDL
jgi:nicotinate-nucleotide pyrophosphorylase (carboxylating)